MQFPPQVGGAPEQVFVPPTTPLQTETSHSAPVTTVIDA